MHDGEKNKPECEFVAVGTSPFILVLLCGIFESCCMQRLDQPSNTSRTLALQKIWAGGVFPG
jgi:hypothetical protein